VAFEIDRDLVAELRARLAPSGSRITIVEGDFLDQTVERIRCEAAMTDQGAEILRAAGNLPYNVASPILFKLVDLYAQGLPIRDATVMLQREVAERLVAPPGTRDYGVLSVLIRHQADVTRLLTLPPGAFRPAPKVHSAVVRLRFHPPEPKPRDPRIFAEVTKAVFTRRRKTLANALLAYAGVGGSRLTAAAVLEELRIDGRRRPESFDIPELVRLSDAFTRRSGAVL
jgi:16S rRNA (adenine1518-N6/adenine1519-N6)-dimethyltransferase